MLLLLPPAGQAYFVSFLQDWGIHISPEFIGTYGQKFVLYKGRWADVGTLPAKLLMSD